MVGNTARLATTAHPSLVLYDELPDSKKDYDRVMVEQAIKAAVALGYRITRHVSFPSCQGAVSSTRTPSIAKAKGVARYVHNASPLK